MDNFASKLENFQSLSNLATRQEIGRNLYLNYIFARYVTSETAEEQLWWLFDDLDGQKGKVIHPKYHMHLKKGAHESHLGTQKTG